MSKAMLPSLSLIFCTAIIEKKIDKQKILWYQEVIYFQTNTLVIILIYDIKIDFII